MAHTVICTELLTCHARGSQPDQLMTLDLAWECKILVYSIKT